MCLHLVAQEEDDDTAVFLKFQGWSVHFDDIPHHSECIYYQRIGKEKEGKGKKIIINEKAMIFLFFFIYFFFYFIDNIGIQTSISKTMSRVFSIQGLYIPSLSFCFCFLVLLFIYFFIGTGINIDAEDWHFKVPQLYTGLYTFQDELCMQKKKKIKKMNKRKLKK